MELQQKEKEFWGVIMGCQLTNDEKAVFDKKCRENKSRLYQARCSETEYKSEVDLGIDDTKMTVAFGARMRRACTLVSF
jgi:hypothetical protein